MKQGLLDTTREILDFTSGKEANKSDLCEKFGLDKSLPLFVFIGRLVNEKPEFEQCSNLAREHGVTLEDIRKEVYKKL